MIYPTENSMKMIWAIKSMNYRINTNQIIQIKFPGRL